MTIKIYKNPENLRSKINELDRPIGTYANDVLRSETKEQVFHAVGAGRKNFLLNGGMQIWQRGTSFGNLPSQGATNYTADRWNCTRYSAGDLDVSRELAGFNPWGFEHCLRIARGGGDTSTTAQYINQPIESSISKKLRGKKVTFSFYAKKGYGFTPAAGGKYDIFFGIVYHTSSANNDDGMYYNNFKVASGTTYAQYASLNEHWGRYEVSMEVPIQTEQLGVYISRGGPTADAVSADFFEVTGLQLEEGGQATPFEHKPYGEELALCQRYFFKLGDDGNTTNLMTGTVEGSNIAAVMCGPFPTTMRDIPAITIGGGTKFFSTATSSRDLSISVNRCGPTAGALLVTISGGGATSGQSCSLYDNGANGYIEFDAEL
jgi:hypothetical protein